MHRRLRAGAPLVLGNAVRRGSDLAREQIMQAARSHFRSAKQRIWIAADGKVFLKDQPQMALSLGGGGAPQVRRRRRSFAATGVIHLRDRQGPRSRQPVHSDHASAFYMYATQAAEVAVRRGRAVVVRILRMSAAHDVGRAINPLNCVAQIEGGVVMGIGSALHEEMVIDQTGKVRNPSFPRLSPRHTRSTLPSIIPIIVECT